MTRFVKLTRNSFGAGAPPMAVWVNPDRVLRFNKQHQGVGAGEISGTFIDMGDDDHLTVREAPEEVASLFASGLLTVTRCDHCGDEYAPGEMEGPACLKCGGRSYRVVTRYLS